MLFLNLITCFLFINLISNSISSLVNRLTDDIQEISISNHDDSKSNIWVVLVAGSYGYFNYRYLSLIK